MTCRLACTGLLLAACATSHACLAATGPSSRIVVGQVVVGQATPNTSVSPTVAAKPAQQQNEPNTQGDIGHPYNLPTASRARMHQCGIEWQEMKMSGAAADKTWRNFAAVCLATSEKEKPSLPEKK